MGQAIRLGSSSPRSPRPRSRTKSLNIRTVYSRLTEIEVNAGVKDGDQVVLQPPVNLADGDKVQVIPEPPTP